MYVVDENTASIKEKCGGQEYTFYLLSPYDRFEIIESLKKKRRDALLANLDAGQIAGEQKFAELEAFEQNWNDELAFITYVNSTASDGDIPERALRMDDKAKAREIVRNLQVPRKRMLAFKAALTGLELVTRDAEDTSPNPPTPPMTYGQPAGETGGSSGQ